MGFDCGFDMVPRLNESKSDKDRWLSFIDLLKKLYNEDPVFQVQPRVITFQVGEYPRLPLEGHKFLRFSSKVSGSLTAAAEPYIRQVYRVAREIFGQQVQFWHELHDNYGYYDWEAVNKSLKSYNDSVGLPIFRTTFFLISRQTPETCTTSTTLIDDPTLCSSSTDNPELAKTTALSNLYIERSIPNKGQGLIAVQTIPKGTRILSEKPIFTTSGRGSSLDLINQRIANELKQVSKQNLRGFLSLHNNYRGSLAPFLGIAKTNGLPLGPDATESGLFLQASRINHDCLPNCQHTWNANIGEETIHAVREIAQGEEITISYALTGPSKSRREHLQNKFGFDCTCSLCSLPATERALSDNRLEEVQHLDDIIGDGAHLMMHPQQHLQRVHKLIRLLEAEHIEDARLPRAYYDAFQTVITHGDQARAKIFAERSYAARMNCEGEDSPTTLKIKLLAGNPKSHQMFRTSKQWRQNEARVPKGLGDEEFEKWLWRQNL